MKENVYELTNPQKSIWYTEQFYQGMGVNNLCGTVLIDEAVDFDKLKEAIYQFVKDNDSFRIQLHPDGENEVKQFFAPFEPFPMDVVSLEKEEDLPDLQHRLVEIPFSFSDSYLHHFTMYQLPNGKGGFVLIAHHLICDACTSTLLASKIMNIYSSLLKGEEVTETATSYQNYMKSEQEYLVSSKFEKDKAYWNDIFETVPEIGTIPSMKQEKGNSCEAERKTFILSTDVVEKINQFCSSHKISNFNFFMAIYAIYVSKVSNLNDFVIGTPILNRSTFVEKTTPGMFISTVPFHFLIEDGASFVDFAKKIAFDSLGMLRHQKYPYQNLLEDIRKKNPSQPNLYDILISYQNARTNRKDADIPYRVEWTFNHKLADSMQIHLSDMNDEGLLHISYDYRLSLYNEKEICALHDRVCFMMEQILACDSLLIKDIDIVTPVERQKLVYEFNDTTLPYDTSKTVVDLWEEQVERTPDNVALVCNDAVFTYQQLNEEANKLAHYLIKEQVKPNDIVGIMLHRSPEMIIGLLAILKAHATYLPIDPEYPLDRISYMLQDSNCQTVLVHQETIDLIKDGPNKIDISLGASLYDSNEIENLKISISPDSLIYMIYTSGSTGKPKGVMLTHRNIYNFILAEKQEIDFSKEKVMVSVTTICFDIFALEIWCSFTSGMKLVLANDEEQMSPILLRELCKKHHVTMIQTTPSRFSTLLASTKDYSFLDEFTDIMVGGEPFPKLLLEKFQANTKARIFNMYGPTETTVWSTIKDVTNASKITIGKPIANTTCYILDKEKHLLPPCTPGELYIGGDGVSKGYWKREELTKEKFIPSPFRDDEMIYNTNDLAYFTEDGELVHLGRTDFQVKIRGYRIELEEIENRMMQFSNVANCVVNPVDNASKLCAYYISNGEVDVSALRNYLAEELPTYMVPNYFVKMERFPYTPNGKINKKALPLPDVGIKENVVAPRNEIEKFLVEELCSALGLSCISITDSFFDIGGDSLTAINLCTKISNQYHIDFKVRDIFEHSVIQEMAEYISFVCSERCSQKTDGGKLAVAPTDKMGKMDKTCIKEYYPLSSAQKRVYYASKMAGEESTLYNMPGAILFDKKPDMEKLTSCFKTLINRHASLRTYFELIDGEVFQKIASHVDFTITEVSEEHASIDDVVTNFVKSFDLAKAPLFRVSLVTLDKQILLLFDMHHIISDGLSLSILTTELSKLYNGEELPSLSMQYVDYAEWEHHHREEHSWQESKDFWMKQFKEDIPVLNMPTDYPRPAIQSFEGAKVYQTISADLTKRLNTLAKELKVSNYMLLLACYNILLAKYTNQEDIVVGSPVMNRNQEELFHVIGMFVNSLPLKHHVDSSMTFLAFLETVKANCMEAFSHEQYPFDDLVNDLAITRDNSRSPLFDTLFTYQNDGIAPLRFDGVQAEYYIPDTKIAKFDLSLEVVPTEEEMKLNFEYCTALFKKETMERFSRHFIHILEEIVDNAHLKISDIDILSEEERNQLLYEFNATKMNYPKDKTIVELWEEQVEKTPHQIAVVFEKQQLTYQELNEKANCFAWYLRNSSIGRNDIVSIMMNRSLELFVAILGVLKSGACYIPIDPNYPKDRTKYMLENSNCKLLLTDASLAQQIDFYPQTVVDLSHYSFSENKMNLPHINEPNDTSYIIYTSGSTGKPKGVVLKHQSLTNLAYYLNDYVDFLKENRPISIASITTVSFDIFIFETLIALQKGLTVVLANEEEQRLPNKLNCFIGQNHITAIQMTPSRMQLFLDAIEDCPNLSNLEYVVLAGEPLPDKLLQELLALGVKKVYNGYGPSETTVFSSFTDVTNYAHVNIGRPLSNTQMYILDKHLCPVPIGVPGELYIAGDGVGKGYLNQEELTKERFIVNPFEENSIMYKTGDVCKFLENGEIAYLERLDHQIKIRGLRIELEEIEAKLLELPSIKKVKVIKQTIQNRDFISAYYVATTSLKVNEIRGFLSSSLPDYMIPSFFTELEDFPYTPNGKIDKKALPIPTGSLEEQHLQYVAPRTDTEIALVSILEEILNISPIGLSDNFFHLGGDSLTAIVLCTNVKQKLKVELSFRDVISHPVIEDLAAVIVKKNTTLSTSSIPHYERRDFYPTSSAQKRMYLASSLGNNSTLYHILGGLLLDNMPDIDKLQSAFDTIVARHDSLRTYFEVVDGNIVQKIVDHLNVKIEIKATDTNDVDSLLHQYQFAFDLSKAPLFHVCLLTLPNGKTLLMLDVHHIIFDGASFNILIQELLDLYHGKELSTLPISYPDFAIWEEEQLLQDGFKESREFWLNQFADDIPILNMPTTYARPANKSYEGSTFITSLSKDFALKIEQFANQYNVTPYMVMLCAYYILLYKYTGQEDIVVGSPISGRVHQELEHLLGMFVNSIPLRSNISSSSKIEEFLEHIKSNCSNAFAHQDFPFDVLVNELNIPRDNSRSPLFDTMFIYQNNGISQIDFDGISTHYCTPTSHTSKFDLSLEVLPLEETLVLSFEYCTALFNEDFIRNFAKHYENILISILHNTDIKIKDISILDEEEKNKILYLFNDTSFNYNPSKTVIDYFEEQVQKTPNKIALVFEKESLTYQQLNEKSNQLAHYLYENGIQIGDSIGIMLHRSLEIVIGIIATLKVGASYIPIDPEYPAERINYILKDSGIKILLVHNSTFDILLENTYNRINIDINSSIFSTNNISNLNLLIPSSNLIYMIYTSGSTGNPKGVMITHKNITNFIIAMRNIIDFSEDKIMVSVTTVCFDIFALELWCSLVSGVRLVLANDAEQLSPNLLRDLCLKNHVTMIQTTPSRYSAILLGASNLDFLHQFTDIMVGGEPFPPTLLEKLQQNCNASIFNMYGPTETTVWSTVKNLTNTSNITIGKPISNTTCYILDKDKNLLPPYIPGELYIGGDGISNGYWNRNDLTNEKFIVSPFENGRMIYNTNDLAYFTKDGEIVHLGRTDFQVKIRGYRIELEEIEKCILQYPHINKCIITSDVDHNSRQFLIAYLCVDDRVSVSKLKMFLKQRLPNYMVPSYFIVLDSMPVLNNGKINRKALPKPSINQIYSDTTNYVAPSTNLELQLAEIFQNLLSISPIGIDDSFFELGGDSLLAINLQVELLKLNLNITYSDIFMYPTIRELAKKISIKEISTFNAIDTSEFSDFNTILENTCTLPNTLHKKEIGNVLITGVTGFLGAHILDAFLEQEKGIAYCLIRTEPGLTLENKLMKKLHFYFGNKYDHYIGNRIVIVNADIVKDNLGLSSQELEKLSSRISCVINCAAKVSHYGDYRVYKEVNVIGTENLLKFCMQFHKRFYQVSTLSVSGNSLVDQSYIEQSFEQDVIFRENNFYINQSLDNVYVRSKFEAEKLVLQHILKGLDGYILRVGNLMNRYKDGKFQPNVDENAYISRLISLSNIGSIPDYMLNSYMEFTPIDSCANAIIKLMEHPNSKNRIFHLYNHNHVNITDFINVLKHYITFDIISNDEFLNKINTIFKQENSNKLLAGILRDFDANKKLVYESKIKLKSDFTIEYLSKIGFTWPKIDDTYLVKFLDYFCSIGYIKREEKI